MTRPAGYVICTIPRSGSTMLSDLLRQTGVAGDPTTPFHRKTVAGWAEAVSLPQESDLEHIFATVRAGGRGADTGAPCGLRIQYHSLGRLRRALHKLRPHIVGDAERLADALGPLTYVYLTRRDGVARGISYLRASGSGLWHRHADGAVLEQVAPSGPLAYDRSRLSRQIAVFARAERYWEAWFRAQGITPLRLHYEDLATAPRDVTANVLNHIGRDPGAAAGVVPATARLADDVSADWAVRYRAGL